MTPINLEPWLFLVFSLSLSVVPWNQSELYSVGLKNARDHSANLQSIPFLLLSWEMVDESLLPSVWVHKEINQHCSVPDLLARFRCEREVIFLCVEKPLALATMRGDRVNFVQLSIVKAQIMTIRRKRLRNALRYIEKMSISLEKSRKSEIDVISKCEAPGARSSTTFKVTVHVN
ncbi:hypothetical protein B0H34DRAFT_679894 [Crassisporium funariophilum]|nr:hypothetical protein B0H34DRAFT_679894 [Crassisporium funariophilum]